MSAEEDNVKTSEEHKTNGITSGLVKKGRGRPRGSKGKDKDTLAQFKNYQPKRWEEWMEAVCMESACGRSNAEIAKRYGYTPQHISNILSCDQAKKIKSEIIQKIKETQSDLSAKLGIIRDMALNRVVSFISNDSFASASPFAHTKIAMDAFKLTNAPDTNNIVNNSTVVNNQTQNNILVANPVLVDRLVSGLEASNRARLLNSEFLDDKKDLDKPVVEILNVRSG